MSERELIIDGRGHVCGKLSAFVSKKLLEGTKVTVLFSEEIVLNGKLERHIGKHRSKYTKRSIVNPEKGAFYYKEPSKCFTKLVRGMIKRKKYKGRKALERFTAYESIPTNFINKEMVKVPRAIREHTSDCEKQFTTLGAVLTKFGWNYGKLAAELKAKIEKTQNSKMMAEKEKSEKIEQIKSSEEFKKDVQAKLAAYL